MNKTLKHLAGYALWGSAAIMGFIACQRELPETGNTAVTEEIPVFVEGLQADTKMTIDGTDGTCAWQENDQIRMWVGSNLDVPVTNGAVRVSLSGSQTRSGWAVYPAANASGVNGTDPTIYYPKTYDMYGGKNLDPDYTPAPMVAKNTENRLRFYHTGAVLRLHLSGVPSNTKSLRVTFNGKNISASGTITVSNAGTSSCTLSGSNYNYIDFSNLTYASEMDLNIPIPPGDYSSLTSITVRTCSQATYNNNTYQTGTVTKNITASWGTIARAQGIKYSISFMSITTTYSPITYTNQKFYISPGFLKWDQDHYTFTDGSDPLDMLNYTDIASLKNVYYHDRTSLQNRLGLTSHTSQLEIQNVCIPIEGINWYVYNNSFLVDATNNIKTFNCNTGSSTYYAYLKVIVDLSDATPENGAVKDYSHMGFNNSNGTYNSSQNTGYVAGAIIMPYYSDVVMSGFTSGYTPYAKDQKISFKTLKQFIDSGCIFIPALGYINSSSWTNRGLYVMQAGYSHMMFIDTNSTSGYSSLGWSNNYYFPVILMRKSN